MRLLKLIWQLRTSRQESARRTKAGKLGHSPGRKRSVACDDVGLITRSVIIGAHPGVIEAGLRSSPRA